MVDGGMGLSTGAKTSRRGFVEGCLTSDFIFIIETDLRILLARESSGF